MVKTLQTTPTTQAPPASRRRILGISLPLEVYAEFSAVAAQDHRKPGALGKIVILDVLARHRSSAATHGCASADAPERSS